MRRLLEKLVRRACEWVAAHDMLPLREIKRGIPPNEEPYLDRYYLFGKKPAYFPERCKWCGDFIPPPSATGGEATSRSCKYGHYFAYMSGSSHCEPAPFPTRLGFLPITVFLHHFLDSDQEEELHNHPWNRSLSFILAGGYVETRRWPDNFARAVGLEGHYTTHVKRVLPFTFNFITKDDFHVVQLLEHDAWTLFFTGKKAQSWGFWSMAASEFIPWRQYREWKEARIKLYDQVSPYPDTLIWGIDLTKLANNAKLGKGG